MLDTYEIVRLENKWRDYKKKNSKKHLYFIASSALLVFVAFSFFIFDNIKSQNKTEVASEQNNTTTTAAIVTNRQSIDNFIINDKKQTLAELDRQLASLNKTPTRRTVPSPTELDFDSQTELEPKKSSQKNSGRIVIKTRKVKVSIEELKDKFSETGDVEYANSIAKEYYQKKDYKNAEKWAHQVNSLNNDMPDGWLIFAKSKYQLGDKDSAILVLENFLRKQPSKEVEVLISQMKDGSFSR